MCIIINHIWDCLKLFQKSILCTAEDFWERLMVRYSCLWGDMRDIHAYVLCKVSHPRAGVRPRLALGSHFWAHCVASGPAGWAAQPLSCGELGRENAPLILNAIKPVSRREIKRVPVLADREVFLKRALILWLLRFEGNYSGRRHMGRK